MDGSRFEIDRNWKAPLDWTGKRCFILGGGPSLNRYTEQIPLLPNPIIAINESIALRPDAEVAFWSDDGWFSHHIKTIAAHTGRLKVCRRLPSKPQLFQVHSIGRKQADGNGIRGLSINRREVGGNDSGGSAINLAFLMGATEIVLLGFDMQPGHWHKNYPREAKQTHYDQFRKHIEAFRKPLSSAGVNVYVIGESKLSFPKRAIEEFI